MAAAVAEKIGLVIITREFRTTDHTALYEAAKACDKIVPLFIFDPKQYDERKNKYFSERSFNILKSAVAEMQYILDDKFAVIHGPFLDQLKDVINHLRPAMIFMTKDYTAFAQSRETDVSIFCKHVGIQFVAVHDHLLFLSPKPYKKFTPFYKLAIQETPRLPKLMNIKAKLYITPDLAKATKALPKELKGKIINLRKTALHQLEHAIITDYYKDDLNDSARLSTYLKYGIISIREAYHAYKSKSGGVVDGTSKETDDKDNETEQDSEDDKKGGKVTKKVKLHAVDVIRQLYWRDFYYQLAWFNPHVFTSPLQHKYKAIPWEENRENITHWMRGTTGVPIVDAGMRHLNAEGWISNRMRLIVSCYLVKVIGANWQMGERYFAMQLEDYDPAVNNGNWQWVASTGADSQPYIRTFNPSLQSKAHDPDALYIKKWVPELAQLTAQDIHKYAQYHELLRDKYNLKYPKPILDFDERKKLIIGWYKAITTPSHKISVKK